MLCAVRYVYYVFIHQFRSKILLLMTHCRCVILCIASVHYLYKILCFRKRQRYHCRPPQILTTPHPLRHPTLRCSTLRTKVRLCKSFSFLKLLHLLKKIEMLVYYRCSEVHFFLFLTDVEGLEPTDSPLSASAQNLTNISDHNPKSSSANSPPATAETVLPDSTSPGSDLTFTESERYSSYTLFRLMIMFCTTVL